MLMILMISFKSDPITKGLVGIPTIPHEISLQPVAKRNYYGCPPKGRSREERTQSDILLPKKVANSRNQVLLILITNRDSYQNLT